MSLQHNIPSRMRAMVLMGHGGLDKLVYHSDWPTPQPRADEVLIRVGACGINNTDINTRTAWYSNTVSEGITDEGGKQGFAEADASDGSWGENAVSFPRIQGADAVGKIVAVGENIDPARIGERIIVDPWLLASGDWIDASRSKYFGSECDGGFAEFTCLPSINAVAINSALNDAELATFPCAYTTAENLISRTQLKPGETVVINGASGGVGSAAIQLCRLRGARVIAVASRSKADLLLALGAEAVIDRNTPNLHQALMETTKKPYDVALDVVGGESFGHLLNGLRQGGRYSSSGAISGPMTQIDLRHLVYKDLQLTGATIVPPGTMSRLVSLIEQGLLTPLLGGTWPLAEMAQAQEAFMAKKHVGNLVITID